MNKLRYIFAALLSVTLLWAASPALTQPLFAATESSEDACATLKDINPNNKGCGASGGGVNDIIALGLNLLSVIAGLVAVIMIIISGFKFITSQGDATEIANARKTLLYAIVGVVVVASAQLIVEFVLRKAT